MRRILFVDDEPMVLSGLKAVLRPERTRWDMRFASSAADAFKAMQEGAVDVVVSDMRMPQIDGATFLQQVRTRDPHVRCVLLSGYAEDDALERARPYCDVILTKPCRGDELVHAISGLLA